jgi:hypothetical protein
MIEITITRTSKGYNEPANQYQTYDVESKRFDSLKEAKDYVKEQYYYSKTKYPIFRDGKDGKPKKIGYIYAYKGDGDRRYNEPNYLCQDWVSYRKVTISPITI